MLTNVDFCRKNSQNLIQNIGEQKNQINKEKNSLFLHKDFYYKNLQKRIIQIIDLVKKNKNTKIKICVNLNSNQKNSKTEIKQNLNNENFLKNLSLLNLKKRLTNKRKGSEITEVEEIKILKKNKPIFFIRQKNCLIPVFIPKINNSKNFRKKKIKKNFNKISKTNFSILRSNNSVIFNNISLKTEKEKFLDKIKKFKLFWKNKKSFYPFAFLKKKIEINNLFFSIEEIFDISQKQIQICESK